MANVLDAYPPVAGYDKASPDAQEQSRVRIFQLKLALLKAVGSYIEDDLDLTHEELVMALSQLLDRQIEQLCSGARKKKPRNVAWLDGLAWFVEAAESGQRRD